MASNMEPTVTIVTKLNNANLSTLTDNGAKESKKDLMMAQRNSTGAIKKIEANVANLPHEFSRKTSEK